MWIDTSGEPGDLICPICGRALLDDDYVYFDEQLNVAGCEHCLVRITAGQLADKLEGVA